MSQPEHTHTPGPWHSDTLLVKDASNEVICHCTRWEHRTPMPEVAVENARLIAAAPEMLVALKAALLIDDAIDAFACNDDVRLMVRAAIAKAEGR